MMRRLGWPAPSMMRGYAAHELGAQVREGGSWRRRSRGGSQSSRWYWGASSRRAVVVVMYGVSGLRRSDEGAAVQVLEEAVRCQSGRAQSTKANAAGVHGPARRAPGLRWQLLIQSFAIAASRYPASVSAVQARRLGR